jgi:hypothetical protein
MLNFLYCLSGTSGLWIQTAEGKVFATHLILFEARLWRPSAMSALRRTSSSLPRILNRHRTRYRRPWSSWPTRDITSCANHIDVFRVSYMALKPTDILLTVTSHSQCNLFARRVIKERLPVPVAQAVLVRGGFVESLRKRMLRVTWIHFTNNRHRLSLRPPIVRGLSLLKQQERDMNHELNINELDAVSGGGTSEAVGQILAYATSSILGGGLGGGSGGGHGSGGWGASSVWCPGPCLGRPA